LDQFSHIWVCFVFHSNTTASAKQRPGQGNGAFRAKVPTLHPPVLQS
jgi:tRNA (Thr-GGU) A37 N-methylase